MWSLSECHLIQYLPFLSLWWCETAECLRDKMKGGEWHRCSDTRVIRLSPLGMICQEILCLWTAGDCGSLKGRKAKPRIRGATQLSFKSSFKSFFSIYWITLIYSFILPSWITGFMQCHSHICMSVSAAGPPMVPSLLSVPDTCRIPSHLSFSCISLCLELCLPLLNHPLALFLHMDWFPWEKERRGFPEAWQEYIPQVHDLRAPGNSAS